MEQILEYVKQMVWGVPAVVMIAGVGLYLSTGSGFVQFTMFPNALRVFFSKLKRTSSDSSSYRALCTALSATVGTGNLAGVAGAIAIGGPGAIFWMWICGFLGMATKYAEATLAVHYRVKNSDGESTGGPMYIICMGLKKKMHFLAGIYCFLGVIAALGVGNATQINTVIGGMNHVIVFFGGMQTPIGNLLIGTGLAGLVCIMLLGGAKKIGSTAERLVPIASIVYILLGVGILAVKYREIPAAFDMMIRGAFYPEAVTGGMIGSALLSLRIGASRGVFTNEAGMGTAAIAHASAEVSHPAEQGMMGIMEVFLDTIVICTITALAILCSGVPITYGIDEGIGLTIRAFESIYGAWICVPIMLCLCCFAFATILGWGLYGARCAQYLFGQSCWKYFAGLQTAVVLISAVLKTGIVWTIAEIVNGLMSIPNLIALLYTSPVLFDLTKSYKQSIRKCTGKIS